MELRRRLRVRSIILLATALQLIAAAFGVAALLAPKTATAVASVPYLINFQGRLTDNNGNVLSDGSYNVKFRIFDASGGGTNRWEGDRVYGASDHRITVQNGLFNIQFGDTSQGDPALSPTLFNTQTYANLYLEVELPTPATATCASNGCASFTEGAMTPRQPLAAAPYAFNSDTLDGLDSSAFGQLAAIQSWTDTNTFSKSGGAAIVLSGSAASGGSILQIGSALSGGSGSGTLFGANTTSAGDLINLQVSSSVKLKVDNSGSITAAGNFQFGNATDHSITVTQAASGTGHSLTVQAGQSGTGASDGGDLVLQAGATGGSGASGSVKVLVNGVDTTTAFQIQNAAAAPAFTVDSVANKVVIGDATGTDVNTTLLVVDTASADPTTGYNGAMYYNSTSNAYRCYQGGTWTTCGGTNITASANSMATYTSGLANIAANQTGTALNILAPTNTTAFTIVAANDSTFVAPVAGSFRACMITNGSNAAVSAGTLGVRWRVNGASVGSSVCNMSTSSPRQASSAIGNGVVTFSAGDTIGVAVDTSGTFAPATTDYMVYWTVEYNAPSGNGLTLQFVYDSSSAPAAITLADNKDLVVNAADTASDSNVIYNLQCTTSCGADGRFAVQNGGTDAFAVNPNSGGISLGQSTTVAAGKSITLSSGTGQIVQTFTNNVASSAQNLSFANTNTSGSVAVQGLNITPTNTSAGTNTLNLFNFAAGGALGGTDTTNGINFASATGYTNYINTPTYKLSSLGDNTTAFTQLDGTSTTNGSGSSSTSLILTSAANFDVGNYVQVNDNNCGGTGVNPCYAKITAKATNTLTITPALSWSNNKTVNEFHLPEIGGIDTSQALANRYGRGYFVAGVAAGNGTTYYNEDTIETSLASFSLLNNSNLTSLTIGNSATATTIGGSLTVTGDISAPSSGTAGYLQRSGTTLSPANSGDNFTTSGNISTTGSGTVTSAGAITAPTSTNTINGVVINGGTISSSVWQGTAVAAAYGGTGLSSYTIGDLLYASGASTLSALNDVGAGSCLLSGGIGAAPTWGSCSGAGGGATTGLNNLSGVAINAALGFQSSTDGNINFAGAAAAAGHDLNITGQTAGGSANNGGGITIQGGTATTTGSGGLLQLLGGASTGAGSASGGVTIDTGNVASAATGSINVGAGNWAHNINIGNTGATGTQAIVIGANGNSGNTLTLDAGTASGSIAIGDTNTNHNIQIGTNATGNQAVTIGAVGNTSDITTIQGGGASTGGILLNATTIGLSATNPTITSSGSNTLTLDTAGAAALTLGGTNADVVNLANQSTNAAAVHIADNGTAHTVDIADGAAASIVKIGSLSSTAKTTIQGGSGNINLNTNQSGAGTIVQTVTNNSATAFQIQNAAGAAIVLVDTKSEDNANNTVNYLTYPGFESGAVNNAAAGWDKVGTGTINQNGNRAHTYNGLFSAQVISSGSGQGITTSSFNATPGTATYIVSWYAKISSGTIASTAFTAQSTDGGTHTCSPAAGITINSSGFQRLSCSITTTGNMTAFQVVQTAGTNTIYYDAIQLQKNSINGGGNFTAPTAYQIGGIQLRGVLQSPLSILPNSDSTSVFQIQNAAGTSTLLTADTLNGRIGIGTSTPAQALDVNGTAKATTFSGSGASLTNLDPTQLTTGTGAVALQAAAGSAISMDSGTTGAVNIGTSANAKTITLGNNTGTTLVNIIAGNITTTNNQAGVLIGGGFSTSDTNLTALTLDSSSTFIETASTCTSSVNGGALYYNSDSNAVRGCVNGSWEDMVSTGALGLLLLGVVPDSGPAPGDWVGVNATLANKGPCKVYFGSANKTIRWTSCVAYSGGRKVVVPAQSSDFTLTTSASSWTHICLNGTDNQPTASAFGTENANLPTFSSTAPVLCLADISTGTGQGQITGIYDTRTFTTTTKEIVSNTTATPGLGMITVQSATAGQVTTSAAANGSAFVRGVIVAATSGTQTAGAMNTIIATAGPTYVKATAGSVQGFVETGNGRAGLAITTTTLPTTGYGTLGLALSAFSATCGALADNCRGSIAVNLNLR